MTGLSTPSDKTPEHLLTHPLFIPARHHYLLHAHDYHELVVVQQGRLRARIKDREVIAQVGDILLYPAGIMHEEWAEDEASVLTWVSSFKWDDLGLGDMLFCHDTQGRVQELVAKLAWEYRLIKYDPEAESPQARLSLLNAILAELNLLAAPEHQRMVDTVRAYITSHIQDSFSLDDLVSVSGLSKSHFMRQYKLVAGRTPMEDARLIRLREARRLIITTKLPLYEIAPLVGIQDVYRLSHLLKTTFGVSLRQLRQSLDKG